MDSNYLRQMSIQNARLALAQAKFHAEFQIESDKVWMNVLTIQNIERIVGARFMLRGIPHELYSFNDYPGRYEYWFWHRIIGSTGRDRKLVLHRKPNFESNGDRYYLLENIEHNTTIRIHPNDLKTPMKFIELLENYYKSKN